MPRPFPPRLQSLADVELLEESHHSAFNEAGPRADERDEIGASPGALSGLNLPPGLF